MSITICLGVTMIVMLFVGGANLKHFAILSIPAVALVVFLILIEPYRLKRLIAFVDPFASSQNEGFQLVQSLLETIFSDCQSENASWIKDFPAHLHIDILDSLQGKGIGKQLMNTLFQHLKTENISGIHLGVDKANENAQGFYKKIGFSVLEEKDWGFVLGKKLL